MNLTSKAMTWLVHQSSGQFNNSFNWVMRTYKVLDLFEQTQAHIVDTESSQRGYLLTGREEFWSHTETPCRPPAMILRS